MAEDQDRKRLKKSRYASSNKKRRVENNLAAGMRGVLITCNEKKERHSVREAYNLLNEYADKIYGKEVKTDDDNSSSEEEDIEKAINKEKQQMKRDFQRFQSVKCGAKNVLFIKTALPNDENPTELIHTMLSDILENGLNKSRDCMRCLPVSATCYASMKEIQSTAENLFIESFLASDAKACKFCVVYKSRNNNSIHRDDVIATLAQIVLDSGMDHSVDLRHPDLTICVEIVRTICCLSVVKDFHKLKKYNIQEIQKCHQDKLTKPSDETESKEHDECSSDIPCKSEDKPNGQTETKIKERFEEKDECVKVDDGTEDETGTGTNTENKQELEN